MLGELIDIACEQWDTSFKGMKHSAVFIQEKL
jgi:hypothetical protein